MDKTRSVSWVPLLIAAAIVCSVVVLFLSLRSEEADKDRAQDAVEEKSDQVEDAGRIAVGVRVACALGGPGAVALQRQGLCDDAGEVVRDIRKGAEREAPAPGLTVEDRVEVADLARQVIAAEPDLSAGQVTSLVREELANNRPSDGESGRPGQPGEDGSDGRTPTAGEVRAIVEAVYAANPPAPGQDGDDGTDGTDGIDGAPGRGITSATVGPEGNLLITYSTGETVNAGRVLGAKGDKGDKGETGQPGSVQPGTYDCGEGEYVTGFDVGPLGVVTLHCQPLPAPPEPEPTTPPEPTPTTEP